MSKKSLKFILFSGLGFFILHFLLKSIKFSDLRTGFGNFEWRFGLLAFGLYFIMNIFRALRFNFFLKNKIGFRKFLRIVFVYNFWNQVLPFRSGEFSYLYFVRKSKKVLLGENIASLVTARIFDLFVVSLFVLAGFYFVFKNSQASLELKTWFLLGIFLIFAIFILLIFLNKKLARFFKKIGWFKTLFEKISQALEAISSIKTPLAFFRFLKYSALIWLTDFFILWAMAASAGLEINFWQAVVAAGLLLFAIFILPFQTPANVGTYEGALVFTFLLFGFSKETAVSASLLIHIENIVFAFILFLSIYIFKKWLT